MLKRFLTWMLSFYDAPPAKQPRKVSLINVHNYKFYKALYEIHVNERPNNPPESRWGWHVFIFGRGQEAVEVGSDGVARSKLLEQFWGDAADRDAADTAAQKCVFNEMEKYKQ